MSPQQQRPSDSVPHPDQVDRETTAHAQVIAEAATRPPQAFTPPPVSSLEEQSSAGGFTPPPVSSLEPLPDRSLLDSAGEFGHSVWEGVGGQTLMDLIGGASRDPARAKKSVETAKGLVHGLINEPSRIWEESKKSGNAMLSGNALEAIKHLAGMTPIFGAGAVQAGDEVQHGEYAKGFGHALGMLAPFLSEAAISKIRPPAAAPSALPGKPTVPERLYQSALNPRITTDPAEVRGMVGTALENGIPVNEAGAAKLNRLLADLNTQIEGGIQPHAQAGGKVDPWLVANRTDDVATRARAQVNPERDLRDIADSQQEFLRNNPTPIRADRAQAMKVGTYKKLNGKYGDVASDATIEAQKALARGIKEELNAQLPELAGLNAKEAKLFDLQGPLEDAVAKATNRMGRGLSLSEAATVGAAHAVSGSGPVALSAGIMKHVLADPAVRSRLAIAIYKAQKANPGKWGRSSTAAATARAAQVSAALAAAVNQKR